MSILVDPLNEIGQHVCCRDWSNKTLNATENCATDDIITIRIAISFIVRLVLRNPIPFQLRDVFCVHQRCRHYALCSYHSSVHRITHHSHFLPVSNLVPNQKSERATHAFFIGKLITVLDPTPTLPARLD